MRGITERSEDLRCHSVDVGEHVEIVEPDYAVPRPGDGPGSTFVVLNLVQVMAAVDFDHKPVFWAVKVDDIRPDRLLSAEFRSGKRPVSED